MPIPRKSQLWTPDVLMYNSADRQFDSTFASNVLVYPDGTTNWIPPGLFRLSCKIEVVWFPFDVQECFMKVRFEQERGRRDSFQFGSWTYDGTKLELQIDENGLDISNYMANGEWHLVCGSPSPAPDPLFCSHLLHPQHPILPGNPARVSVISTERNNNN